MRHEDAVIVLMADDDEDDRLLTKDAFVHARIANELRFVTDGVELLQYLRHEGAYADPRAAPMPGLILLDLNMPRMDGREALRAIRADPALCHIPVIVLTTSRADIDVYRSYALGANSYIPKPVDFKGLVEAMRELGRYWFHIVELPMALPPEPR